jgi:hypothetical protein
MRLSHVPLRLTTGAFLLDEGLGTRTLVRDHPDGVQPLADGAADQVPQVPPAALSKALTAGEVALGAALLVPFVSPVVAGAALTAFSGALLRTWWLTPGTHEPGSIRPTKQGKAVAKDVWLLGAGLTLVADGLTDGARRTAKRTGKAARRRTKAVREALPVG